MWPNIDGVSDSEVKIVVVAADRSLHENGTQRDMEQCPAKSPCDTFSKFPDKQKKSNARIEMYG